MWQRPLLALSGPHDRAEPWLLSGVKPTSADLSEMSGYDLTRTFCAIGGGLVTVAFDPNVTRLGKFATFKAAYTAFDKPVEHGARS
jgi:hypothetical protein